MAEKKKVERRSKTIVAFEKVDDALRILAERDYMRDQGGRDEVRYLLGYFNDKYRVGR